MASDLTVFKIETDHEFIPKKAYKISLNRKYYDINCIKSDSFGENWYFYTDLDKGIIFDLFDSGIAKLENMRIENLKMGFLSFVESRNN